MTQVTTASASTSQSTRSAVLASIGWTLAGLAFAPIVLVDRRRRRHRSLPVGLRAREDAVAGQRRDVRRDPRCRQAPHRTADTKVLTGGLLGALVLRIVFIAAGPCRRGCGALRDARCSPRSCSQRLQDGAAGELTTSLRTPKASSRWVPASYAQPAVRRDDARHRRRSTSRSRRIRSWRRSRSRRARSRSSRPTCSPSSAFGRCTSCCPTRWTGSVTCGPASALLLVGIGVDWRSSTSSQSRHG